MIHSNAVLFSILIGLIISIQPASANDIQGAKEYRIHLTSPGDDSALTLVEKPPPVRGVTATLTRNIPKMPRRQRNPEFSSTQIVIIAYDKEGREVTRVFLPDPRLIRAETVSPSGELQTQNIYRKDVDFTIVIPDDPNIKELKIYHPEWTGKNFILEPLGETQLP